MQIIHLVDSGGMGGIERHIEIVCAAQRAIGLDARVLLIDDHAENTWPAGLSARDLPHAFAGGAGRLAHALRNRNPALVHTHGYKAGVLGRIICCVSRIPVVSAFHAGEIGAFPVSLYQRIDILTSRHEAINAGRRKYTSPLPRPASVDQ